LIGKLLDLYANDPDAGVHGAAEWTLRKWDQSDKLKEIDNQLMKQKDRGERRWFVNGQGQTFAVIEGPVEFLMGTPATEPGRSAGDEPPRRIMIPRSFAIAAKEVTKDQFQRFLKVAKITNERYVVSPDDIAKLSPDPDGPWVGLDWYSAAHYCNWLSEQEELPKDQWCYLPNEAGVYAEGMSIPANVLDRKGYRLPTEAEWEYACRAGAVTSRYYGNSTDLLDAYAWFQAKGKERARTCGSLLPNDLGLFDMHGNEFEWTQDSINRGIQRRKSRHVDNVNTLTSIREKNPCLRRGGSFAYRASDVRSAARHWSAPASRILDSGFRPARTYP
jgi:eukaryotic-like serine/threonine-protein kinase